MRGWSYCRVTAYPFRSEKFRDLAGNSELPSLFVTRNTSPSGGNYGGNFEVAESATSKPVPIEHRFGLAKLANLMRSPHHGSTPQLHKVASISCSRLSQQICVLITPPVSERSFASRARRGADAPQGDLSALAPRNTTWRGGPGPAKK